MLSYCKLWLFHCHAFGQIPRFVRVRAPTIPQESPEELSDDDIRDDRQHSDIRRLDVMVEFLRLIRCDTDDHTAAGSKFCGAGEQFQFRFVTSADAETWRIFLDQCDHAMFEFACGKRFGMDVA